MEVAELTQDSIFHSSENIHDCFNLFSNDLNKRKAAVIENKLMPESVLQN
jgi:hypothetical protein